MESFVNNIKKAISCYSVTDYESALLHAVIAVNSATAQWRGNTMTGRCDYKEFIRHYDWLIECFGGLEPSSVRTQQMVVIKNEHNKIVGNPNPDIADIVYHIFRCKTCHGSEIPLNYKLNTFDPVRATISSVELTPKDDAVVALPSSIIIGLIAACVFNSGSASIESNDDCFLSYDSSVSIDVIDEVIDGKRYVTEIVEQGSITNFPLRDWWGKEDDIKSFLDKQSQSTGKTIEIPLNRGEQLHFRKIVINK